MKEFNVIVTKAFVTKAETEEDAIKEAIASLTHASDSGKLREVVVVEVNETRCCAKCGSTDILENTTREINSHEFIGGGDYTFCNGCNCNDVGFTTPELFNSRINSENEVESIKNYRVTFDSNYLIDAKNEKEALRIGTDYFQEELERLALKEIPWEDVFDSDVFEDKTIK